ncbi:hypothetical protein BpHYR1_030503 [Brachionus plicatilis]|uniref:Uncharacterized protein n=1 Tax=Brachionus plicatilis TaxID=10195 RepID=A0A3M7R8F4_BRAPC|nr:hypothetical protein BpHYR1_030503 [Brachionus plicatilis]
MVTDQSIYHIDLSFRKNSFINAGFRKGWIISASIFKIKKFNMVRSMSKYLDDLEYYGMNFDEKCEFCNLEKHFLHPSSKIGEKSLAENRVLTHVYKE